MTDSKAMAPARWSSQNDADRAEHTGLRYRMLRGEWQDDLEGALQAHVPAEVREAWGPQDLASNVFRSIAGDLGPTSYLTRPDPSCSAGDAAELIGENGIFDTCGYWPLMQGVGEDIVGMREVGMRLEWDEQEGLCAEPIPGHRMEVDVAPGRRIPTRISILDERPKPDGGGDWWCWETWDISDPMAPRYIIEDGQRKEDVTAAYAMRGGKSVDSAAMSGEGYPWRGTQGSKAPFIPVPVYHALRRAAFWDPRYGIEAVAGSLTLAVLNTFWVHCIRDGSIATILLLGGIPAGLKITKADGSNANVTAWTRIAAGAMNVIEPIPGVTNVQAIQLQPSARPLELIQAIQMFEQRVAVYAGVSVSDLLRGGGDPRSGYALSVSNEGRRTAAKRLEPQLAVGDVGAMEVGAKLANLFGGRSLPESGYRQTYRALPLTPDELRARGEHAERMVRLAAMSRKDVVQSFNPEWSPSQIAAYLAQVDTDRRIMNP